MKAILRLLMSALAVLLMGCTDVGQKEQVGTVLGGVLGGIGGAQIGAGTGRTAAIIGGALLGSIVGGQLGRSVDRTDELKAMQALEYNRTGQASSWENPRTGGDVTVVPVRTYQAENEQYCREYQMTIVVEGRRETGYGTACRQPDGSWRVVS